MSLRRLQKTPLTTITLPQDLSDSLLDSSDDNLRHESFSNGLQLTQSKSKDATFRGCSSSNSSFEMPRSQSNNNELKRFSSILRYQSPTGSLPRNLKISGTSDGSPARNVATLQTSSSDGNNDDAVVSGSLHLDKRILKRSMSDGKALRVSRCMNRDLELMNQEKVVETDGDDDLYSSDDADEDERQPDIVHEVSDKGKSGIVLHFW